MARLSIHLLITDSHCKKITINSASGAIIKNVALFNIFCAFWHKLVLRRLLLTDNSHLVSSLVLLFIFFGGLLTLLILRF